jgi:excisionase family DNA binding protein
MDQKLLLRVEEAAQMLGICRAKAYQLAKSGELPSIKLGSSRRVPIDALREWVAQRAAEAKTEAEGR